MSRKVEFRNNHYIALLGIGNEFLHFLLRVVPTIALCTREVTRFQHFILTSPSTLAGQLRILLDFDAPAVVVGQVEMKFVKFMVRHPVDVILEIVQFEERARHIEHESTIAESRSIFYRKCPDGVFLQTEMFAGIDLSREELEQCLHAIIFARCIGRNDGDACICHIEAVTFLRKALVGHEADASAVLGLCAHGDGEVEHIVQLVLQIVGREVLHILGDDGQSFLYYKGSLALLHLLRSRNDIGLVIAPTGGKTAEYHGYGQYCFFHDDLF